MQRVLKVAVLVGRSYVSYRADAWKVLGQDRVWSEHRRRNSLGHENLSILAVFQNTSARMGASALDMNGLHRMIGAIGEWNALQKLDCNTDRQKLGWLHSLVLMVSTKYFSLPLLPGSGRFMYGDQRPNSPVLDLDRKLIMIKLRFHHHAPLLSRPDGRTVAFLHAFKGSKNCDGKTNMQRRRVIGKENHKATDSCQTRNTFSSAQVWQSWRMHNMI